jgi:hypothetical protein
MKIFLSYGYWPFTTGVYLEKALMDAGHAVSYIGPSSEGRRGFACNEDVSARIKDLGGADFFLFVEPPGDFFPRGLEKLACPTACYLIDVHLDITVREKYAVFFDHIFVAQKDHVQHFKDLGHTKVYWLPLGCDAGIHAEKESSRIYDIGFVGSCSCDARRSRLLEALSRRYTMNDYMRRYAKEDIALIYSQSRIVVNVPVKGDLNMRVFEAMASGALLITEAIDNGQRDLFKDQEHLVEYGSEEDLFNKVDFYLSHTEEREKIARSGQASVTAAHTYRHRVDFILNAVFGAASSLRDAPVRKMSDREVCVAYARVYAMLRLVDPVFDEIKFARQTGCSSMTLWLELVKAFLRRLNSVAPFTFRARIAKKQKAGTC